jgi:hypothetical protein
MEKNCKSCGQTKSTAEFYKHPKTADGFLGICKECQKAVSHKARKSNLEHYREYDRTRAKLPHRIEATIAQTKKRRSMADGYMAAHSKVSHALDKGILERKPCEMCGTTAWVHAHHDDYRKPLDVMWLCPVHHKARHAYLKELAKT